MERRVKDAKHLKPWYFDDQGIDRWLTATHKWRRRLVQSSRWRKRKPLDCGKTRCTTCHWKKYYEPKRRNNKKRAAIQFELEAE